MTKRPTSRFGQGLVLALFTASMLAACRGGEETAKLEAKTDTTAVAADTSTPPAAGDTTQR